MILNWWTQVYSVLLQDNVKSKTLIPNCGLYVYGDNFVMCRFRGGNHDTNFMMYQFEIFKLSIFKMMYPSMFVHCYQNGLGMVGRWP